MSNRIDNRSNSICVVVPVFNRINLTERFVQSVQRSSYRNFKLVIIDDGSTDGTSETLIAKYREVIVLKGNGNLWWAGATNVGVKYAIENNFDFVLTINNDSLVDSDTLEKLLLVAQQNPRSIIGARIMLERSSTVWALGVRTHWKNESFLLLDHFRKNLDILETLPNPLETTCLTGNGTLIPTAVFRDIGLYNSFWCPQYHADTEFTLRARSKGYLSLVALDAVVYNNNFDNTPTFRITDELFSKRSHRYWRPIVYVFLKYSPFKYKVKLYKNFYWLKIRITNELLKAFRGQA